MEDLKEIYRRFLSGRCSPEEVERLLLYFDEHPQSEEVFELIQQEYEAELASVLSEGDQQFIADTRVQFSDKFSKSQRVRYPYFRIWTAAVACILLLAVGTLVYQYKSSLAPDPLLTSAVGQDVLPGGNRASITLADGTQVTLDSNKSAVSTRDGKFYYEGGPAFLDGDVGQLVTLSTPTGGTYRLTLADGTKAWLNAASSVTYPVRFGGPERRIKITGEVYLEVAPDPESPFVVESDQQRIQVLGTAFNIRTYDNRTVTTLLHGKIALESGRIQEKRVMLSPGDQVRIQESGIIRSKVDPEEYVAWKNGVILSRDATLHEIVNELERWYDVRFIFPSGAVRDERAIININKTEVLSAVLKALEDTYQVKFTIKGKEVIVH